jgi:hypothetical protein
VQRLERDAGHVLQSRLRDVLGQALTIDVVVHVVRVEQAEYWQRKDAVLVSLDGLLVLLPAQE